MGEVDLYAIKRDHGGVVYDGGRRWVGPGPGHSRRDTSLSVRLAEDGRALVHSFAGDPFPACADHLRLESARPDRLDRQAYERQRAARARQAAERDSAALAFCERVWAAALPLEETLGAIYLQARAVGWLPADVVFHPNAPRGYSSDATGPAIVALARSVTGTPKAIQATFLAPDGRAKTRRATFGSLLGAAVRLSPIGPELAVAEGLETAASFAELEGYPTWATLGTANLEAFQPPSCVRRLIIAADADAAGTKAAHALAARIRNRCDVTIMAPPAGDWNDVAIGRVHV